MFKVMNGGRGGGGVGASAMFKPMWRWELGASGVSHFKCDGRGRGA